MMKQTFSVRPRSSVGRMTVDLIRRSWVGFPPRSKDFFFTSCGSLIPFTRANAQWDIHGFISTLIYTSELILCFTICVHSAIVNMVYLQRPLSKIQNGGHKIQKSRDNANLMFYSCSKRM